MMQIALYVPGNTRSMVGNHTGLAERCFGPLGPDYIAVEQR